MTDTQKPPVLVEDLPNDPALPSAAIGAFAELGRINLADNDLQHVLHRVAELARDVVPGVGEASVTLMIGDSAETAAFTGEVALALDERQYAVGRGPCMAAATDRTVYSVPDMASETRWPEVAAAAVALGVHSSLSVGIPVQDTVAGGLNLYGFAPHAFTTESTVLAETFTTYAAVAMANAYLYSSTAALADQMSTAMESRAVIEQAKGILMAQRGVGPDEAFQLLAHASQTSNRKLRDIATAIVTGATREGRPQV